MRVELAAPCLAKHDWELEIYPVGRKRDSMCLEEIR